MEQKKIIINTSIIALASIPFILVWIWIMNNKKEAVTSPVVSLNIEEYQNPQASEESIFIPLTEEKKAELIAIRNITGKITSININTIELIPTEGKKIILKVPSTGANFFSQTVQKDGSFLNKEIGLLELPKDKKVDIQYNSQKMEVMLVVVK